MRLVTDNSVFVRPGSQMIPRETWINEALNDSALFQATLLPSAAHYALFYNQDLAESFHLFDQTTRTVYKRLGDPEQGTSDATLAAVICLSFVEVGAPFFSPPMEEPHLSADVCRWKLIKTHRTFSATVRLRPFIWTV